MATTENWKDANGNKQERTEWHRIVIFAKGSVSFCEKYVHTGDLVCVEGQLRHRSYEDKNGTKRTTSEVVVSGYNGDLISLGSKGTSEPAPKPRPNQAWDNAPDVLDNDDVPF